MAKIKDIVQYLEFIAPLSYQEDYDNCGLITGSLSDEVKGILITLDSTEEVIDEAIKENCNLVIAHHPIVFKGLKKFNGNNYVERTIIKAIKNDIAIYAIHTNLDHVKNGVNGKIAEKLGLINLKILSPKKGLLKKLITFIPFSNVESVTNALYEAGAGNIGNYSECSYQVEGTGTFRPNEIANPAIGSANKSELVQEKRVEIIFPSYLEGKIITALFNSHPYEEPAYDIIPLENKHQEVGSGAIGILSQSMNEKDFIIYLKERMNLSHIRHTNFLNKPIQKVAVCGGSGSFLLKSAISAGADIFITADFKYHEFFDAENKTVIADIGHYESEVFTKELIYDFISKKFANIAVRLSKINTNPISYT